MRRISGLVVVLSVAMSGPIPVGASSDSGVTLEFTHPSHGGPVPAAGSSVAVFLFPFDAPDEFVPPQIARGTTDEAGRVTFELTQDPNAAAAARMTSTGEINVIVRAFNDDRTWSGDWEFASPISNAHHQLRMRSAMDPASTEDVSADQLLATGPVITDTPPAGFSCDALPASTQAQPVPGPADGSPPWDPYAACADEEMMPGSGEGIVIRWVKYMGFHLSEAMSGTLTYAKGRGSKFQEAYQFCYPLSGGCGTFRGGMMRIEENSRSTRVDMKPNLKHTRWMFEYKAERRRRCVETEWQDGANFGRCKRTKRYFVPLAWTWGTDRTRIRHGVSPKMREDNRIVLATGATLITEKHRNKVFGKGVTIMGLSLDSQANYSEITQLSWAAEPGCRKHYLYGKRMKPRRAPVVYARSMECG